MLVPVPMKPGRTGLGRIIDATGHSVRGLHAAFVNEAAFRQELALSAILLAVSFWLARNVMDWILLVAPLTLLLIVELLNSAIEAAVDRIGKDRHVLAGRAKDMGSAAVMLCLFLALLCWGAVAWDRFG